MGQAKSRGSYDERKAEAIIRNRINLIKHEKRMDEERLLRRVTRGGTKETQSKKMSALIPIICATAIGAMYSHGVQS